MDKKLIFITGPTATGKTRLAALLANEIKGEIISADSRQVFKGMDLGTGKDLNDYCVNGNPIPYHLIDIALPGSEFSVFDFKKHATEAIHKIWLLNKMPVVCGGTGLYIQALAGNYSLPEVPKNTSLRNELMFCSHKELIEKLKSYGPTHNITDFETFERTLRSIEIKDFLLHSPLDQLKPDFQPLIFAIHFERDILRQRISSRLKQRLEEGMVDEVKLLLEKGVSAEMLHRYGLEYRWVTAYLTAKVNWETMVERLTIAIHQFAKRQITWFRRMERNGFSIQWIEGELGNEEKIAVIINKYSPSDI